MKHSLKFAHVICGILQITTKTTNDINLIYRFVYRLVPHKCYSAYCDVKIFHVNKYTRKYYYFNVHSCAFWQ